MRLEETECRVIADTLRKRFGEQSRIWLFGSRVDDTVRGGDIDIYLEPEIQAPEAIVDARLELVELKQRLGDQRIDRVIHRAAARELPIHAIARETGVRL